MRTVFAVWLTLSALCVGCADHRSSENEAKDRVGVIVDGPGSKSVPDVRVPTGNAEAKPLDLKPLIETARRHGLPMPSTEARLVLAYGELDCCRQPIDEPRSRSLFAGVPVKRGTNWRYSHTPWSRASNSAGTQ